MPTNAIVEENSHEGSPEAEWDVNGAGDPSIQGFSTDISANRGQTVGFKIKTDASKYRIDIYRLGYYGGLGARLIASIRPSVALPQSQPDCLIEPETKLYDCGNWALSASWGIPDDAVSGLYVARPVREDDQPLLTHRRDNSQFRPYSRFPDMPDAYAAHASNEIHEPRASHIYFIVRDDEGESDILFQTADPTWQAYNRYGGSNTYRSWVQGDPTRSIDRAYKVSFNRPLTNRDWNLHDAPLNDHYPMIRWLERNGYDVSYFAGVDTDRHGDLIRRHKVFIANGHDEYWSGSQRRNVEAARDAGVSLMFLSGNGIFWKTRYESSIDRSASPYRTLVVYKETHSRLNERGELQAGRKLDPLKDVWTGTWRDSSDFNPEGSNPENALMGQIYTVDGYQNSSILVPGRFAALRFWRHTSIAELKKDEVAILDGANLGHEWDEDLDNGFRPDGLMHLSETTVNDVPYVQDWGSVYESGTATHHLTLYRSASGALVFSAGTCRWAWGLDAHHDRSIGLRPNEDDRYDIRIERDPRAPDHRVEQATVNLLADMGVQSATLASHLTHATPSTDFLAPVSRILSPAAGAVEMGGVVTLSGTAVDRGGGHVAAVEVSVDGGSSWHPAHGLEEWVYDWIPDAVSAEVLLLSRATDDSGNIEVPGRAVSISVQPRHSVGSQAAASN